MATGKILLIEDSTITQALVMSALKDICQIETAGDGAQAVHLLAKSEFDLILLDVQLPDIDGFALYEKIREIENSKETPIMFLTAQGDIEQRVKGFSLGADDYVVKPFQLIEFHARVAAKLRNIETASRRPPADSMNIGPFRINIGAQKILLREGGAYRELDLTGNQFKVLFYLLRHEGKMVKREELLKEIWGDKVHVSDRTIDSHVYAIRQTLGTGQNYLRSVHGKGYCLRADPGAQESA